MQKQITVVYYAQLQEQRGQAEELIETPSADVSALYKTLQERHGFTLNPEHMRVAINDRFVDWNTALSSGDTVVFIPPVSGG